jgi:molybdopterin converting factor small subunit
MRVFDDFSELSHYRFVVSLNNELITGDAELKDGDEAAMLPPFSGG